MFDEENTPKPKGLLPLDLDTMSIEALEEYIVELETEIVRIRAKINSKQQARGTAESFFKK